MKKSWMLGSAAAVALVAAAGSARAADVMPIVVPVVTPAVVPVPGPVKVVQIDTSLSGYPSSPIYFDTLAAVDVRMPSGWGFQLLAGNTTYFGTGSGGYMTLGARAYRAIGDATVGAFAAAYFDYGLGFAFDGASFGLDADYHTDAVELYYAIGAQFDAGFDGIAQILIASIERGNFRIDVVSQAGGPPVSAIGAASIGYAIGPVTPFVILGGGFNGLSGLTGLAGVGVEIEQEVGDRLTLNATAQVVLQFSGMVTGLNWGAGAGFEYTLGGGDGPLSIRGNVMTGSGGGLAWEIGLGLKFGDGRVTGVGGLNFAELPTWFAF